MNTSPAFKEMDNDALQKATKDVVGAITVITGCTIEPALMRLTLSTIKQFLQAHFGYLTPNEVQEAFQMNSVGRLERRVQHFGRSLNCDYIGEVLEQYAEYRRKLMPDIMKVYREVNPPMLPDASTAEPVSDDDRAEVLQVAYTMYRQNPKCKFIGVEHLHTYCVRFGMLTQEEHTFYLDMARARLRGVIAMEIDSTPKDKIGRLKELAVMSEELSGKRELSRDTTLRINEYAKEMMLRTVFKKLADEGKEYIFGTRE